MNRSPDLPIYSDAKVISVNDIIIIFSRHLDNTNLVRQRRYLE